LIVVLVAAGYLELRRGYALRATVVEFHGGERSTGRRLPGIAEAALPPFESALGSAEVALAAAESLPAGRSLQAAAASLLEGLQPLIDVEVQLALPVRRVLGLELQCLDLPAQRLRLRPKLLDAIRELDQAFVVDDPLDAHQARLEIGQAQVHRIVLGC